MKGYLNFSVKGLKDLDGNIYTEYYVLQGSVLFVLEDEHVSHQGQPNWHLQQQKAHQMRNITESFLHTGKRTSFSIGRQKVLNAHTNGNTKKRVPISFWADTEEET